MTSVLGKVVLVPLSLLLLAANLSSAPPAAPTEEQINQAVRQLGDDDFKVREKASAFLWNAGRPAEKALQQAARSDDIEVARRAKDILQKFKYGIFPDTPEEVVKLIRQYRSGDANAKNTAASELLKLGRPGAAAVGRLLASEEDAGVRQSLSVQIGREATQAAGAMLAQGNVAAAEDLLEMGLASGVSSGFRNYAAYQLLRGQLDGAIKRYAGPAGRGDKHAAEVLAYLYRAKGDLKSAGQAAEMSGKAELVEAILLELGDWPALARVVTARKDDLVEPGVKALYYRLAGNSAAADAELRKLHSPAGPGGGAPVLGSGASAPALFFNDRPQEAIAVLGANQRWAEAFEFLTHQLKLREANELAAKGGPTSPDDAFRLELLQARLLHQLGDRDKARQRLAALVGKAKSETGDQLPSVLEAEYQLGLKDEALEHCGAALAADGEHTHLLKHVFPKGAAAEVWWKFFRKKFPAEAPAATLKRVRAFLDEKKPGPEFTGLVREAERDAAAVPAEQREPWLEALADVCQAAGADELARDFREKAARASGTAEAWAKLGDFLAERKHWRAAAEAYERACEKDPKQAAALYLRGWALVSSDRTEEGRTLMDRANWRPLADESARWALAEALAKHGLADDAERQRDLIRRTGEFQSKEVTNVRNHDGEEALARKDYEQAAVSGERVMLIVLQTNLQFVKSRAYLSVPCGVHRNRALADLKAGRFEEARKEVGRCLDLLPGDIDLAVQLVPELARHGRDQDADDLFEKVFAVHARLCADYPNSAWCHNNLAWLSARCRRRLDEGLEHSRKAVELTPKHAGNLDTLAEVYFQRGDKAKAVELMKQCIDLDPKHQYFRKQLKRFEAGDPKADVPGEG